MGEVRVYSVPNLLEGAIVIQAPPPTNSDYSANNLVTNLDARGAGYNDGPIINWNGGDSA